MIRNSGRKGVWTRHLAASAILALGLLVSGRAQAQTTSIKPRILIIFDTSGSMQYLLDSDTNTQGDGSWDPWGTRSCCPGSGNSRLFAAKEAIRQMVFATGDIDFGLMKFAQNYVTGTDVSNYRSVWSNWYAGNQVAGQTDVLRYWSDYSTRCLDFAPFNPAVPGSAHEWLCVEFPDPNPALAADSRGPIMMWLDHHEFLPDGSGQPDTVPAGWSRVDNLEQELRATTYTPLADSMDAARDYLMDAYAYDLAEDADTALCRPYSVILLTDGEETCGGNPDAASARLRTLENAQGNKTVDIWVIGFAFSGDASTLNDIAENGGTGSFYPATSESELSGVLYEIIADSRLVEECNYEDDDCDGETDEGFRYVDGRTFCNPYGLLPSPHPTTSEQIVCARPPEQECDGIDDNCDGEVDEPPDGQTSWPPRGNCGGCDLGSPPCTADPDEGECRQGEEICLPGFGYECVGSIGPTPEVCDCLDNDCDGEIDEGIGSPVGDACNLCGVWQCVGCELVCSAFPDPEICNGLDDNCNGLTDENIQQPCGGCTSAEAGEDPEGAYADCLAAQAATPEVGPGEGECQEGVMWCDATEADLWGDCIGSVGPTRELCDAKDNDCDGITDEEEEIENTGGECATAVGICEEGWWRCADTGDGLTGIFCCKEVVDGICIPPQGPAVESCNGLDDDCDGATDEELPQTGQPCGNDLGICEPGHWECVCAEDNPQDCEVICVGATGGTAEICNALDDDCDGLTDEDIPQGDVCTNAPGGVPTGECDSGFLECEMGQWVCAAPLPGEEICNGLDDDCDGATDEDLAVECPAGSICIEGECAKPCAGQEFACPSGMTCEEIPLQDNRVAKVCLTDICREDSEEALPCVTNPYWCSDGEQPLCECNVVEKRCVNICKNIPCPAGTVCVPDQGQCRTIDAASCYAAGCPVGQICVNGTCAADPCAGVTCAEGQYCNASGLCVGACVNVECPGGICIEGQCANPCAGIACAAGQVCNKWTGSCELANACDGITCPFYQECQGGLCVQDPCWTVRCPNGTVCDHGSCYSYGDDPGSPDADGDVDTDTGTADLDGDVDTDTETAEPGLDTDEAPGMTNVLGTGRGGCMCSNALGASTGPVNGAATTMAALIFGLLLLLRRRRYRWVLAGALVLAVLTLGCDTNPYKFGPPAPPDGGASTDTSGTGTGSGGGSDTQPQVDGGTDHGDTATCDTAAQDNNCDGVDDDCDGKTDEDVNLQTNSYHCGACGNDCSERFPNAFGLCQAGACVIGECLPYYSDDDGLPENGCETVCVPTSALDGCDGVDLGDGAYVGIDNDCDGLVDEDVDFQTDNLNCGACGSTCSPAHGGGSCVAGACTLTGCDENFYDIDGVAANGCEYACLARSETETCNNVDDNCNGQTDEGNPEGGAECYPKGVAGCPADQDGVFHCVGACAVGHEVCRNGIILCEGYTPPTLLEECNGIDDNCNGDTDENLIETCTSGSVAYEAIGACVPGIRECVEGVWGLCMNELPPQPEICDGVDNDCDGTVDDPVDLAPPSLCNAMCPNPGNNHEVCVSNVNPPSGSWRCDYHCVSEGGVVECGADDSTIAADETLCDGYDNDCDGVTDEGFALWGESARLGDRCTNDTTGECGERGWVKCSPDGTQFVCCSESSGGTCAPANVIPENVTQGSEATPGGPDGNDNDCDGYPDDGVDCAETIDVNGVFEIFRFEASRWDASAGSAGNGRSVACSADGVVPWTQVNFNEARDACLRLNEYTDGSQTCSYTNPDGNPDTCWDLCTAEQWFYACAYRNPVAESPYLYPYGNTYNGTTCNGDDYTGDALVGAGDAASCSSPWGSGIFDMSGNAEEWTLEPRTGSGDALRVIRGGSYKTVAEGLACNFNFLAEAEDGVGAEHLGFRCCKGAEPITACEESLNTLTNYPYNFDVPDDSSRCRVSGWYAGTASSDEWEIGKSTASVGNSTCMAATLLNSNYNNDRDSYLYSPVLEIPDCVGSTVNMTWNMWLDIGSGDRLRVQVRSSNNGGEDWGSWSTVGADITADATDWATVHSRTVIDPVQANRVYQVRFHFDADGNDNALGAYLDNIKLTI